MTRVNAKKTEGRIVSLPVDDDELAHLDALAGQTSCPSGEVLRRTLGGAQLKSTIDAPALTEVARVPTIAIRRSSGLGGFVSVCLRETQGGALVPPHR